MSSRRIDIVPFGRSKDLRSRREDPADVLPPRSNILLDGRWVGHVGSAADEQIVICTPVTDAEQTAIVDAIERDLGERREVLGASVQVNEALERERKRIVLSSTWDDEEEEDNE